VWQTLGGKEEHVEGCAPGSDRSGFSMVYKSHQAHLEFSMAFNMIAYVVTEFARNAGHRSLRFDSALAKIKVVGTIKILPHSIPGSSPPDFQANAKHCGARRSAGAILLDWPVASKLQELILCHELP
jgi:hypothetical protein